jgi:hypothetical protein
MAVWKILTELVILLCERKRSQTARWSGAFAQVNRRVDASAANH